MARGRLRIYLGAAPGVGKTMAMLSEGHRRAARGTDVVVAFIETHGRQRTADLVEGLEVVPRARVTHREAELEEMDLDAVLARHPTVALVDELAHTNVPGLRHEKRWQDIEELLAAGIDVISTVNIQHLESLNDAVESITGVLQRETVPDEVVRRADQLELVDMSPEALRRRMAHGNVYRPEKVDAALSNYFRVGNLAALRELALLWLADRVDEGLERYRDAHGIAAAWPARERVVAAVGGGPEGEVLLRRAARIASRGAGGELLAVHVARSDGLSGPPLPALARQRRLTEELGGSFHIVTGDEPAEAILDYARGVNASQVVIGSTRLPRWRTLLTPSTTEDVILGAGDIDVHVVTHAQAAGRGWRTSQAALPARRVRWGYAASLLGPTALTAVLGAIAADPGLGVEVPLYLLLTVLVALLGGLGPALVAAVASSLLVNWFFTPPLGTLTIAEPENVIALIVFLVVASLVAFVVHRSARRADLAVSAQQESAGLAELTHTLLGSTDQMTLLLARALDMFGAESAAVVQRVRGAPEVVVAASEGFDAGMLRHAERLSREPADETHDLVLVGAPVPADRQRLLAAYAAHAGAILHRRELQASASEADALARDNSARRALLSAVSHDLRTPLAGIKAAVGSLRSSEVTFSPEDEAELMEAIEDSADRLDQLIGNLLDMSRLQAGALVAAPRPLDLGEVVPQVVAALSEPERVEWALAPEARRVMADPGLLDRVLGNIIENAVRHQPRPGRVRVGTSRAQDRVEIRVADTGSGVDEAQRERIFLPFQRHGDAPAGDGVGLGLAVARGLAEAMGGQVDAEDTPGGGLTMVVSLPVVGEDAGHG